MRWKYFFDYTKAERRGIFILLSIIVVLLSVQLFFIPKLDPWEISASEELHLERLKRSLKKKERAKKKEYNNSQKSNDKQRLNIQKNFDPNALELADWIKMGLNEKQAQVIINYTSKGGRFYNKEDVKKMYSISADLYHQMEPFIAIPKEIPHPQSEYTPAPRKIHSIQLNTANAEELQQISGVGPSYSKRIIKYRDLLGGYVSFDQLYEVYGFDSVIVAKILPNVRIALDSVQQINVNSATTAQLFKHPYLNKRQAYAIVNYREQNGAFKNLDVLMEIKAINESDLLRVLPYLKLED